MHWEQRTDVGSPGPRLRPYDEAQQVALLHGGVSSQVPRSYQGPEDAWDSDGSYNLWRSEGTQWTQVSVTGQAPNVRNPRLIWHGQIGRAVLMGHLRINAYVFVDKQLWSFVFVTPNPGYWPLESAMVPGNSCGSV